jgi:hypothetical protein
MKQNRYTAENGEWNEVYFFHPQSTKLFFSLSDVDSKFQMGPTSKDLSVSGVLALRDK